MEFTLNLDSENFYKTLIVDYLISNSDRHGQNWGFWMDNKTGRLLGLHPLFDHNNAFDKELMRDRTGGNSLMMPNMSKLEAAVLALGKCDFQIKAIPQSVFVNKTHYDSFAERLNCLELSMELVKNCGTGR